MRADVRRGISLVGFLVALTVLSFVFIGFIIGVAGFVYQIVLAVQAWSGKSVEIPLIHGIVKQYI